MGVLECDGARFLVGKTYLRLGHEKGVTEFLKISKCAEKMAKFHGCERIITTGTSTLDIYHVMRRQTRTAKF